MSLKDVILAARDVQVETVDVPEWDCKVNLKVMSAGEREAFETRANADRKNLIALLLVYTLCDENGALLFSPDQTEALSEKNVKVLWRLHEIAARLNRVGPSDVDTVEKN